MGIKSTHPHETTKMRTDHFLNHVYNLSLEKDDEEEEVEEKEREGETEKENEEDEEEEEEEEERESGETKYIYYSNNVLHDFEFIASDIGNQDAFKINDIPGNKEGNLETTVWIGEKGVTASTHYDPSHNFYVQLDGTKVFLLSPPSSYKNWYLNPYAHPNYRQAQYLGPRSDQYLFPQGGGVTAHVASLQPGDLLYLPPFWFHRVTALSPSMSVNMWSLSRAGNLLWNAAEQGLPLVLRQRKVPEENIRAQRIALAAFIDGVLQHPALELKLDTRGFIVSLLQQRFLPHPNLLCDDDVTRFRMRKQCMKPREVELVQSYQDVDPFIDK